MPSITRSEPNLAEASARSMPSGLTGEDRERVTVTLLFVLSLAYLCVFRHYSTLEPDEGIVLRGAERIIAGEVPYRDFFSFYTPGSFYLVAFLFRVFGDSFAVARTSLAFAGAIGSVVTYLLARRVCPRAIALFAALLATIAGAAFRFLVLHNAYSTLLCCVTLYAAVRFLETQKTVWAFWVGSLASLTFLLEQSKGAGLCAGLALGFIILRTFDRASAFGKPGLLAVASGFAWPLVATFAYFALQHSLKVMVQSWLWPLHNYTHANRVPYGFQNWSDHSRDVIFHTGPWGIRAVKILVVSPGLLVPVLPLIAIALLVYWNVQLWRRSESSAESRYYVLVCSVLLGLLMSVVVVRADVLHFMYLAPLWYVVLAWIMGSQPIRSLALAAVRPFLIAYVVAAFGLLGMAVLFSTTGAHNRIETRRGVITSGEKDTVIDYVQAHLAPRQELLVYPYLPLYNYLTGTRSPSRYDYFQPGMNTREQANEIITSLQSKNDGVVLYEPWFAEKFANSWPGTSLTAIADDPVADYIVRSYRVCKILNSPDGWRFHYMVRRDIDCP